MANKKRDREGKKNWYQANKYTDRMTGKRKMVFNMTQNLLFYVRRRSSILDIIAKLAKKKSTCAHRVLNYHLIQIS